MKARTSAGPRRTLFFCLGAVRDGMLQGNARRLRGAWHMNHLQLWRRRFSVGVLAAAMLFVGIAFPQTALAGNTGNLTGTVTDVSGKPLADVQVTASSASQTASATTDSHGFYSIVSMI